MSALGVLSVLVLAGGDVLSPVGLQGLSFKAPVGWQREQVDPNSLEWTDAGQQAKLAVSVYQLERPLPAEGCVKKMVEALGTQGFEMLSLGGRPAAKKITSDFLGEGEAAKTEDNRITTTSVVGCSGRVKWLLTFTAKTSRAPRFGPVLKRILESVSYRKAP